MLRAAARALRRRPEAARVAAFLRAAALPDGSFRDRAGRGDLYYTVFGLQILDALRRDQDAERGDRDALRGGSPDPPRNNASTEPYLRSFGAGASLDFVHTACLARCWALVAGRGPDEQTRRAVLARLETWRSADGGYNPAPGAAAGTAYASFLALGACEDFEARVSDETGLARSLAGLRSADGGYANTPAAARGSTAATAAAIVTLMELGQGVDSRTTGWLLTQHGPEGGFRAMPAAPIPDLLSTATALHALARAGVSLDEIRQPCREFVEGLWADDGGFRGHWADDATDCEYTFYGLLALGQVAE
jgi:prenyltransferase beta subunit